LALWALMIFPISEAIMSRNCSLEFSVADSNRTPLCVSGLALVAAEGRSTVDRMMRVLNSR